MSKLILMRHLMSEWNRENKFTGWQDAPLSEEGIKGAPDNARKIADIPLDVVFTSPLSRNKETARLVCEGLDKKAVFLEPNSKQKLENGDIPVYVDAALNERKYGELEGKNKDEVKREFGEGQVHLWRRSWDIAPPSGESLKDVYGRTTPFFQKYIKPELSVGKNVLVVASHNSLRALAKYLEKIPDDIIADFEIPFGGIIVYELGQAFNLISKENL